MTDSCVPDSEWQSQRHIVWFAGLPSAAGAVFDRRASIARARNVLFSLVVLGIQSGQRVYSVLSQHSPGAPSDPRRDAQQNRTPVPQFVFRFRRKTLDVADGVGPGMQQNC